MFVTVFRWVSQSDENSSLVSVVLRAAFTIKVLSLVEVSDHKKDTK